jgi:hypothetical protein
MQTEKKEICPICKGTHFIDDLQEISITKISQASIAVDNEIIGKANNIKITNIGKRPCPRCCNPDGSLRRTK